MPDIDFQRIVLNIIPKQGDEPVVFYASQYETTRPFIADLMWGDTEFAPGPDCWAEIDIRKNDDNLVVITEDVAIDNNEVSVILPVQALTCIGKNLGQVKIYAGEDQLIAALNFIIDVQPDPLAGGVTSDTAIDNLESQIAAIVPEVVGEDYYDKTEVDALLADKADVSDIPDMTDYYTKSQVYNKTETDALLNNKADIADLPDMSRYYTKLETNALLANYVETSYLTTNYYTRSDTNHIFVNNSELQFALQLEGQASGSIATFETAAPAQRLAALKCNFLCSGGNGTPSTPIPLVPYTELNVVNKDENDVTKDSITIDLDGTRYGGYVDANNGKLVVTMAVLDLGTLDYAYYGGRFNSVGPIADVGGEMSGDYYVNVICDSYENSSSGNNNTFFVYSNKYIYLYNSDYTDANAFKTSLSGVMLAYELATPIEVDISPEYLNSHTGINNVSHDGNGTTEVKYKDTIQHYIDTRV